MKKKFFLLAAVLIFYHSVFPQYVDPLRNDGSRKSAYERQAEESRNKQENAAYWKRIDAENVNRKRTVVERPEVKKVVIEVRKTVVDKTSLAYKKSIYSKTSPFSTDLIGVYANGKWGFVNEQFDIVIPLQFEQIDLSSNNESSGPILVRLSGKWGYINKKGDVLIPFEYDELVGFYAGLARVRQNGKYGFINSRNIKVIPAIYQDAKVHSDGLAVVQLNNKYGCIDITGKTKIPFVYDYIMQYDSREKMELWVTLNNKRGVLDRNGKISVPIIYEDIYAQWDSLRCVKLNGKWGFIDQKAKIVIPFRYDTPSIFSTGISQVFVNNKTGIINKKNVEIVPVQYDKLESIIYGMEYYIYINDKKGIFSKKEIIPPLYDVIVGVIGGMYSVRLNDKWGFYTKEGVFAIAPKYDQIITYFEQEQAVVRLGKDMFIIDQNGTKLVANTQFYDELFVFYGDKGGGYKDKEGNIVVRPIYESVREFSCGFARVELNDKYGFINRAGNLVIPAIYNDTYEKFKNGFLVTRSELYYEDKKYGYIDTNGKRISKFIYDEAYNFSNGVGLVGKVNQYDGYSNKEYGFINAKGEEIIPIIYGNGGLMNEGVVALVKSWWGVLDSTGKEVMPFKYEKTYACFEGMIGFTINGKSGYANNKGIIVIPAQFDKINFFKNGKAEVELKGVKFFIDKMGNRIAN